MVDKGSHDPHAGLVVPEYFAKILKSKDRIIRAQAKRIEALEGDIQRLRLTRETLNTQLALLSYKLQLATGDWDQNVAGSAIESKLGQSVSRLREKSCHLEAAKGSWKTQYADTETSRSKDVNARLNQIGLCQLEGDREVGRLGLELCDGLSNLVDKYAKKKEKTSNSSANDGVRRTVADRKLHSPAEEKVTLRLDSSMLDEKCMNYIKSTTMMQQSCVLDNEGDELLGEDADVARNLIASSDDGKFRFCSDDGSFGSSPCASPVAFQVDQPSYCFEYQLEDHGLEETKGSINQNSHLCDDYIEDSGGIFPLRKPWLKDGLATAEEINPVSSPFQMLPSLHSVASSKYVGNKGFVYAPLSEFNLGHKCRCRANAPDKSGIVCQDSPEMFSGMFAGQGHGSQRWWKPLRNSGHMYCNQQQQLQPPLPTMGQFARLSCASSINARSSPIWKRKSAQSSDSCDNLCDHSKRNSELTECSEHTTSTDRSTSSEHLGSSSGGSDSVSMGSGDVHCNRYHDTSSSSSVDNDFYSTIPKQLTEKQKKRLYRIGLNLFNRKPERGIIYLVEHRFLESSPLSVAKFLISRKGLSKQMIGEYLGNIQLQFNMEVLDCFVAEVNLSGLQIDEALRRFQSYFQMPGEAQKIERLMEAFARCFSECNPDDAKKFNNPDAIFLLAYAIVMLNTDLHNSNIKADKKMKLKDFIRNFRGIDGNGDVSENLLAGIYNNISSNPFHPANDHVTQVIKVDQMIVGKKPQLVLPYRRLVCYCRLSEIPDPAVKPERGPGHHQREVFLFNDLLMVTKLLNKKKNLLQYTYRQSYLIFGMMILLFETPYYKYGIQLASSFDGKVLMNFAAQNEEDRKKFIDDLQEAILEINEMEAIRTRESETEQMIDTSYSSLKRGAKVSFDADLEPFKEDDELADLLLLPNNDELQNNIMCDSIVNISEGCRRLSSGSLDSGLPSTSSGSIGSVQDRSQPPSVPKFNVGPQL